MGCRPNWAPRPKVQEIADTQARADGSSILARVDAQRNYMLRRRGLELQEQQRSARQFLANSQNLNYQAQGGIRLQEWAARNGAGPRQVLQPRIPTTPTNRAIMHRPGGVDVYSALEGTALRPGGFADFLEAAGDAVNNAYNETTEFLDDLINNPSQAASDAWDWFADVSGDAWQNALDWLGEAACSFLDAIGLKDVFAALYVTVNNMLNRPYTGTLANIVLAPYIFLLDIARNCDIGSAVIASACAFQDSFNLISLVGKACLTEALAVAAADCGISAAIAGGMSVAGAAGALCMGSICRQSWPSLGDVWNCIVSLLGAFDVLSWFPPAPQWVTDAFTTASQYWNSVAVVGDEIIERWADEIKAAEAAYAQGLGVLDDAQGALANVQTVAGLEILRLPPDAHDHPPGPVAVLDGPLLGKMGALLVSPLQGFGQLIEIASYQKEEIENAGGTYDEILEDRRKALEASADWVPFAVGGAALYVAAA